jgi:ADP-ribosyl-[dinitrogen reductase] hydrolase
MKSPRLFAFEGALVADALAMPVHWYYDRIALRRDYGRVDRFLAPLPHHPDSILHRSKYIPLTPDGDILHDQARFWGQAAVHYHQNLRAGENTLNFQLARALYGQVRAAGHYDADAWLRLYIDCMRIPGWHRDTYVEECHRGFFTNLSRGKAPRRCGIADRHIGGLAAVAALFAGLDQDPGTLEKQVLEHVALTHLKDDVLRAARTLVRMLELVTGGAPLRETIERLGTDWISPRKFTQWSTLADEVVVGEHYSPACYIRDAFPAALYLSWKYAERFDDAVIANAHCGGDNCHRGAVVGALVGAACGVGDSWLSRLHSPIKKGA